MSGFWRLVTRDIRLALREGGSIGTALGFYLIVIALIPIAGDRRVFGFNQAVMGAL